MDNEETDTKKRGKVTERQLAYRILREQGLTIKDAAKSIGYHPKYAYRIDNHVVKSSLVNNKMVSIAHKAIKNCMKGKPWGEISEIKDSTALAAAKEVMDRSEPKINQNLNMNLNATISPVDLTKYLND